MLPSSLRHELDVPTGLAGESIFKSFFLGGFECSTHRLHSGRRLDLVASTKHDRFCELDYRRLWNRGIRTAREGIRWHLMERTPGVYDFASVLPIVKGARATCVQLIWDLCHYGWPEDIDIFKPEFVHRFTRFVGAFARWLSEQTDAPAFFTPINEISFFAWAAGDAAYLNPHSRGRGFELKVQLARAAIEAMETIWSILPSARFAIVDPIIHVVAHPNRPEDQAAAEAHRLSQFQAWDMLCGRLWPQLGGQEKYLDIIGVNFYPDNEWIHGFGIIRSPHPLYRPLSDIIREVYERYRRPLFIAETGTEDQERPAWLRFVCDEAHKAMQQGVALHGICLYPILNHPGWDNDRHCHNGLWDYADSSGEREIYQPFAEELKAQQTRFQGASVSGELEPVFAGAKRITRRRGKGKSRRLTTRVV